VEGRVVCDENDDPIGRATVDVQKLVGSCGASLQRVALLRTADDGSFRVVDADDSVERRVTIRAIGREPVTQTIDLRRHESPIVSRTWRLRRVRDVVGRVVDDDGGPICDVTVETCWVGANEPSEHDGVRHDGVSHHVEATDSNGRFVAREMPLDAPFVFVASKEGWPSTWSCPLSCAPTISSRSRVKSSCLGPPRYAASSPHLGVIHKASDRRTMTSTRRSLSRSLRSTSTSRRSRSASAATRPARSSSNMFLADDSN